MGHNWHTECPRLAGCVCLVSMHFKKSHLLVYLRSNKLAVETKKKIVAACNSIRFLFMFMQFKSLKLDFYIYFFGLNVIFVIQFYVKM